MAEAKTDEELMAEFNRMIQEYMRVTGISAGAMFALLRQWAKDGGTTIYRFGNNHVSQPDELMRVSEPQGDDRGSHG